MSDANAVRCTCQSGRAPDGSEYGLCAYCADAMMGERIADAAHEAQERGMSDIVERLHQWADIVEGECATPAPARSMREAATAIEARDAEIARLREVLAGAVELFDMDDEANTPGTHAFTWLHRARAALKAQP